MYTMNARPLRSDEGDTSVAACLRHWAHHAPHAPALLAPGRAPLCFADLAGQSERLVCAFAAQGVPPRARIAIGLPQGPEMAAVVLAVACTGACVPFDPRWGPAAIAEHVRRSGAVAMILPASGMDAAHEAAHEVGIRPIALTWDGAAPAGMVEIDAAPVDRAPASRPAPGDVALVLQTSGTSGQAKRVLLTQRNICSSAEAIAMSLRLGPEDRSLCVMPLFHIHGLVGSLLAPLWAGGSVACTPGFDPHRVLDWLEELRPTWYSAVPAMHAALLSEWRGAARRPRVNLRFARSASAALPKQLAIGLEDALRVPVIEAYGMTEGAHQIASNPLPPGERRHGSVGTATRTSIAILGGEGQVLPPGSSGEICIRGENVTTGYEADDGTPDRSAFVGEWLRTGDEGHLDVDGYLVITGRLKEMINRAGEKIVPREVEECFLENPQVRQVVVFGVPHPTLGEDVAAAIVSHESARVDVEALRQFVARRLPSHAIPARILQVSEIPVNATGKVQRHRLADQLRARLETPYVEPRGAVEVAIAEVFADVLGIEAVGACDNFFTLGGESLRGAQALARLRARFRIELPLAGLFRMATPAELAWLVEAATPMADPPTLLAIVDTIAVAAGEDAARRVREARADPQGHDDSRWRHCVPR
ncbi:MAG: non-ribosomal peptide synthetase [Casimicrobiaceae bacterium]